MKAGADLQETGEATPHADAPRGWFGDPAQDLEQRALASAIAADDSYDFSFLHFETHIFERPEAFCFRSRLSAQAADAAEWGRERARQHLAEAPTGIFTQANGVFLADILNGNRRAAHFMSLRASDDIREAAFDFLEIRNSSGED